MATAAPQITWPGNSVIDELIYNLVFPFSFYIKRAPIIGSSRLAKLASVVARVDSVLYTTHIRSRSRAMSSGNANFSSICHENRWDLAIDTYFSKDHVVEIDDLEATRCVFRLPKPTIETNKPEAYYAPQRLGFGPYHHFRPGFDTMQLHKISRVRSFLGPPDKLEAFNHIVADLVKREPIIRACYDEYLDFDIKTIARILAVDALYLLHLLHQAKDGEISDEIIAADILMVENQIPALVFKVIN